MQTIISSILVTSASGSSISSNGGIDDGTWVETELGEESDGSESLVVWRFDVASS